MGYSKDAYDRLRSLRVPKDIALGLSNDDSPLSIGDNPPDVQVYSAAYFDDYYEYISPFDDEGNIIDPNVTEFYYKNPVPDHALAFVLQDNPSNPGYDYHMQVYASGPDSNGVNRWSQTNIAIAQYKAVVPLELTSSSTNQEIIDSVNSIGNALVYLGLAVRADPNAG